MTRTARMLEGGLWLLRRRWWAILLPLVAVALGGLVADWWQPARYRSEVVIGVPSQPLRGYPLNAASATSLGTRLRLIAENVQSGSGLLTILREYDIYKEPAGRKMPGNTDALVQRLRRDISVDRVDANGEPRIRLAFAHRDPSLAQRVTERLAALYLAESLNQGSAAGAPSSLDAQLRDAKDRLTAQEQRLANYRRLRPEVPSPQRSSAGRTLQNAQARLQALGGTITRARQRRLEIERAIAGLQPRPVSNASGSADAAANSAAPSPAARQLGAALARLDVLKVGYPQGHPDIAPLEQTIRTLQAEVEKETAHLRDLKAELNEVDGELAADRAEETRLRKTIADAGRTAAASADDSELATLTRDYASLQEAYSNLLRQRGPSALVDDPSAVQLKVVAPPTLPSRPINEGPRQSALLGGALGGLAVGLLLVGLLGYRALNFRSEDDVRRLLALPVLALIPPVETTGEGPGPRLLVTRGRLTALAIIGSATAAVLWRLHS